MSGSAASKFMGGGINREDQNHFGMYRVPAEKLRHNEGEEASS